MFKCLNLTFVNALVHVYACLHAFMYVIKTHGSESRGQEEAACTRVFWPTRPLQ